MKRDKQIWTAIWYQDKRARTKKRRQKSAEKKGRETFS
jgi:hypothetical protein